MTTSLSPQATARLFCLSLLVAGMCFVAIFPMPYGYYMFLRWVVSATAVAMAVCLPRTGSWVVAIIAGGVAILFNPIAKVPLGSEAWKWFDAGAGLFFLFVSTVLVIHRIRTASPPLTGDLSSKLEQAASHAEARIRDRHKTPSATKDSTGEAEEAIATIRDLGKQFDEPAFSLVAQRVEALIKTDPVAFGELIQRGTSIRRWVWGALSNAAGDLVESGEFHVYRGMLNPAGPGDGLVRIFDTAVDELVRLGAAQPEAAARNKVALRRNIASAG